MVLPIMFAGVGVSEWIFGNRQKGLNENLRQEFIAQHDMTSLQTKPALFHCVVRKKNGFTHSMTGIEVGDVVEVLQEGCGPEKQYNLCRLPRKPGDDLSIDTYGWFPFRWLQQYDHYESIVRQQMKNSKN
jgi:hypothetical protein